MTGARKRNGLSVSGAETAWPLCVHVGGKVLIPLALFCFEYVAG